MNDMQKQVRVAPKRGTLIIPLDKQVRSLVPHARRVLVNGEPHMELPHSRDEVQLLRNLGWKAPAPILHRYKWPGHQLPFPTQFKTAAMTTMNRRAYVLNQFGTGKTRATLYAIDYLRMMGEVNRTLVVAPLSTLNPVWYSECFLRFPNLHPVVLYGTAERRRKLLADTEFNVYIINHDALGIIQTDVANRPDINTVIIDELTAFRNFSTDRYKLMYKIVQGRDFIWGLTGAPTPNAPTDAWAQCRLVTPETVPKYFREFREKTMLKVSNFKWVPKHEANDIVLAAMQPAVCYTRAESFASDQPIYSTIEPPMSKHQTKFYNALSKKMAIQYKNHEITAANEGVKLSKLLQVGCGYIYDTEHLTLDLSPKGRIQALLELIEEADAKTIVFVPFIHALKHVTEAVSKHYSTALIYGDVKKQARDVIFSDFQKMRDPAVIVAHPKTMSHGLTLTAASTIVWYSPTTSLETYIQASARVLRESQQYVPAIVHMESTAVEKRVFGRLKKRQTTQGVLLEMFKEVTA